MTQRYTPATVARMCSRKTVRAKTRAEAKRLARELGGRYGKKFETYQCNICGMYHLSTAVEPVVPVYAGRRLVCYAGRARAARLTLALLERGLS